MRKFAFLAAAALLAAPAMATNLITNGSFETGNFSGWTQFGNTGFTGVQGNFSGINPSNGANQAFFGPVNSTGGITQTISTVIGSLYALSFDVAAFGGGQIFQASIGGSPVLTLGGASQSYAGYTFNFVAGATSTAITFTTRHDPSYYLLDNVSVVSVPEPQSWALLIAGFGLVGAAARRRRTVAA